MNEEHLNKLADVCDRNFDKLKPSGKDKWDKSGLVLPSVAAALVALAGWWFTNAYQNSQLDIQKSTLLEKYIPRLEEGGSGRKVAIIALARLGYRELALEMASIYGGEEAANAVTQLGASLQNVENQLEYFKVYRAIVEASPDITTVGNPNYSELEAYTVTRMVPEIKTREVAYTVMVPEERTRTATVQKMRQEERTREVEKIDPETGKPMLDKEGDPIYVPETYTVSVPYTEEVQQNYTVQVPQERTRAMHITVTRPVTETRMRDVAVFENNYARTTEVIRDFLQVETFTNRQALFERVAKALFVTADQENALKRQIAWHTKMSKHGKKLVFRELPTSLPLPDVIKRPLPVEDYPTGTDPDWNDTESYDFQSAPPDVRPIPPELLEMAPFIDGFEKPDDHASE